MSPRRRISRYSSSMFDALLILNVVVLLRSLQLLRPATLTIAINQIVVLRALQRIKATGRPRVHDFIPEYVFSPENLAIAANIFVISTAILIVTLLFKTARLASTEATPSAAGGAGATLRKATTSPPRFPPVPRPVLAVAIGVYLYNFLGSSTIISYAYTDANRGYDAEIRGGHVSLLSAFLVYECARRAAIGLWSQTRAFGLLLILTTLADFLKGATGLPAGHLVTAAVLISQPGADGRNRWVRVGAVLSGLALAITLVRGARTDLHREGVNAIYAVARSLFEPSRYGPAGEAIEEGLNASQYAMHLLSCITLWEAGISRQWRSLTDPLYNAVMPAFLIGPLGLERPRSAPWELGDHFIHNGGIYALGEFYWNGGYLAVATIFAAIAWFSFQCDTRYRTHALFLVMAANFSGNLLQGLGYGFSQVSRGAINGLIAVAAYHAYRVLAFRRIYSLRRRALALPTGVSSRSTGGEAAVPEHDRK